MKKTAFVLGIITVLSSLLFLYFGSVIPSFNSSFSSKILGIIFEVSLVLSSVYFLYNTAQAGNWFLFVMILLCLLSWIGHLIITLSVAFTPAYSYAMDVFIVIVYMYYLSAGIKEYWS
ncbi:MAG: hypothetical protein JW723_01630 [Bacteroidales bacterium]|nr:hypothetical protein [Bacteroidales bacterium]